MKKFNYFLMITAIFVVGLKLVCNVYTSIDFSLIAIIVVATIIYCIALGLGLLVIADVEFSKGPSFLSCHKSRTIFIFSVKRDKIGFVDYEPGISIKNYEEYSPLKYLYPTEIPKNLSVKGKIIEITEKEEYVGDCCFFEFKEIKV